jgi:hypothetical protein
LDEGTKLEMHIISQADELIWAKQWLKLEEVIIEAV